MQQVDVPIYDFKTHQRSPETRRVEPADVVIVEGIMVLHMEEVRQMLNMKIYVDTDDDVRLARRYVCTCEPIFSSALRCISARLPCTRYTIQDSKQLCSCRIQRDVAVRGRDVAGVIEQYTQFVKPMFDQYVAPSRKHADVIIPWAR